VGISLVSTSANLDDSSIHGGYMANRSLSVLEHVNDGSATAHL
jgi:hypothetical protein